MAAIGWYGPLIDLAMAGSHVGDLVQLLVVVNHTETVAVQKSNTSNGGTIMKTKVQVSDDTRTYFSVSLWPKHVEPVIAAGDVIFLQNVKIIKYRDVMEATALHNSLLHILVHSREVNAFEAVEEDIHWLADTLYVSDCWTKHLQPNLWRHVCLLDQTSATTLGLYIRHSGKERVGRIIQLRALIREPNLLCSLGVDKLLSNIKLAVGFTTREKLKRVLYCVQRTESEKRINWKADEKNNVKSCPSISELLVNKSSCVVKFYASVHELRLPDTLVSSEIKNVFLSYKSLVKMADSKVLEYLIGMGCRLCAFPLVSRSIMEEKQIPLYCQSSSNYVHEVGFIYRSFTLDVWDNTGRVPILVKNKAAEALFGNVTAEMVHSSHQRESKTEHSNSWPESSPRDLMWSPERKKCHQSRKNFYRIWLIILKLLLQQCEQNSPFHFEVAVDCKKDIGAGRFELISIKMPCNGANIYSSKQP